MNCPSGRPTGLRALQRKVVLGWKASRCWIRYLLAGSRGGVPGLLDFVLGNYFFPAWQVPDELRGLGEILAARPPERALEIGTANGGTLLFLTKLASPQATIVSVDLPGGRFGGGYSSRRAWFYKRFAGRKQRVQPLQGDSHTTHMVERVKAVLEGHLLDYLFIDGDHTYEGVKRDFELYGPLVRGGGIIALHDIVEGAPHVAGGVPRFWHETKPRYRHTEIIKDRQQGGCGIGVLYVD